MIKDLLTKNQKHLLWQDDQRDLFVLLKGCEVFEFNNKLLRLIVWRRKLLPRLRNMLLFSKICETDDNLALCEVDRLEFNKIKNVFGTHKRRPHIKGEYLKNLKERLGHDIKPYRTELPPGD